MSRVSVIVVSHGRPALLGLCLTGIGQLCYSGFELIVVADSAGLETVSALGWADRAKTVRFETTNISAARNAGLAVAAGEIVAFIDDDAVPEPSWLDHLVEPFADTEVAASGGYVIGRNGISLQWGARAVNNRGEALGLDAPGDDPFVPTPPHGFAVKTEGTNMAFRRRVLDGLGGFDPAFRYYLDETDLNLRLAASGGRTVLVPRARVHHGYGASARRAADRAPRDLTEIGASTAVFARKHAPEARLDDVFQALRLDQRRALIGHMVAGALEPRDVGRLLSGLEAGFAAGRTREIAALKPLGPASAPFMPFRTTGAGAARHLAGRPWNRAGLHRQARVAVAGGEIVTVYRFSPTALRHRVRFHPGGWWEQTGGLFGPSARHEPAFRWSRFKARVAQERARVAPVRQCR